MNNIIRVKRANVKFCEGIEIDGYQFPDGEFGVNDKEISKALGFNEKWLIQTGRNPDNKTVKLLYSKGFKQVENKAKVERDGRGEVDVNIHPLDNYLIALMIGAQRGCQDSFAKLMALSKMSLNDLFREAFDEVPLTLEEKRRLFYKSYAATINWFEEDRREWQIIEEQERFLELA